MFLHFAVKFCHQLQAPATPHLHQRLPPTSSAVHIKSCVSVLPSLLELIRSSASTHCPIIYALSLSTCTSLSSNAYSASWCRSSGSTSSSTTASQSKRSANFLITFDSSGMERSPSTTSTTPMRPSMTTRCLLQSLPRPHTAMT